MIENWIQTCSTDKVIVGGDFNVVPSESRDRFPFQPNQDHLNYIILDFAYPLNLVDI